MNGIHPSPYQTYENGTWTPIAGNVTEEAQVCLHVNGQEIATLMCTPRDLDELAMGFLRAEGIIQASTEVEVLTIAAHQTCVDVWLKKNIPFEPPKRHIRTSGCGGGVTFDDLKGQRPPLKLNTSIHPDQIFARMHDLYQASELYEATRGIHTAALADNEKMLLVTEDIGRHNAVDRIWGKAMKQNIPTAGRIWLDGRELSAM
ncbi:MAG TPA: formate dehydrogenase accessory sulfurtransferase FdhD, partial [Anaerolineales bacterium]|nr:formate dehydrogenase accessory sulfurtransferase FdhD [Anaerolineales bacterium]